MSISMYEFIGTKVRPIELAAVVKGLLRIHRRFYLINDYFWYIDPVSNFGLRLIRDRHYEPETTELILNNLQDGDIFVDVGGNEGYYSILASKKVGKTGKVYCIEPQLRLLEIISRNINKNECYNVIILPYALSERKEEVSITLSPSINPGSSSMVKLARRKFWKNQQINSTTLDELFTSDRVSKIKLIKIDIEGYEFFALKGGKELLKNKVFENIILEFHPPQLRKLGQTVEEICGFLNQNGYNESKEKPLDENLTMFTCDGN